MVTINLGAILPVILQIVALIVAISASIVWLRKWLRNQVVVPMAEAKRQLEPNGSSLRDTTRFLIEQTSQGVTSLGTKVDEIGKATVENSALIHQVNERLDRHILMDHGRPEEHGVH